MVENSYDRMEALMGNMGASPEEKALRTLRDYLEYKRDIERAELVRRFSSKHGKNGIPARQLTLYLKDLMDEGAIEVWSGGQRDNHIHEKTHERYVWVERDG